jgi:Spy/CpxP family protein refolding chaperone
MSKVKILSIAVIAAFMIVALSPVNAQESELPANHPKIEKDDCHRGHGIPDLSDKQEEQLKAIHMKMMKENLPVSNKIKEKEARLNTLKSADKVDMAAINTTIDEISDLRAELAKGHAAKEQEIRKLLTEEQRIFFDSHRSEFGSRHGMKSRMMHSKHKDMCKPEKNCKSRKHHKRS